MQYLPFHQNSGLSRRAMLRRLGAGLGSIGLAGVMGQAGAFASPASGPEMDEQAQLYTEVDQPGTMETPKAPDQVVEAVVVAHGPIVAWSRGLATPGVGVPFGDATVPDDSWF